MNDLISRQAAIEHMKKRLYETQLNSIIAEYPYYEEIADDMVNVWMNEVPSIEPEPTLYGYPIEHLAMIARVMTKEHCTPEDVVRLLQNAGEIALMVRDEMMEMLKECVERTCKGEVNDSQ